MIIVDAQLSPHLAPWMENNFSIKAFSVAYLGLRDANDLEIFNFARKEDAIIMTMDEDVIQLLHQFGSPPKLIWITCGNTSNERMKLTLKEKMPEALHLLQTFELVEITD